MRAHANSAFGTTSTVPLGCTASGCTLKWTNDYGRRLCSEHDRILRFGDAAAPVQKQIPETLRPAAPHWQDAKDDDEVPF